MHCMKECPIGGHYLPTILPTPLLLLNVSKIWMILFGQCSTAWKSVVKVQKHHLVAELKLKMSLFAYLTFSISALPPSGVFPLWLHFWHPWSLSQRSIIHIYDTSCLDTKIRQNVKNECIWASCISDTLKNKSFYSILFDCGNVGFQQGLGSHTIPSAVQLVFVWIG